MSKFDSAGRKYIDISYLALSDIPTLLSNLATLADPGEDALLVWDDALGELAWQPFVQNGIYAGYCTGSAGASVAITTNTLASSWTVSQQATGRFRVVHNLDLANSKLLSVVANVTLNAGATDDRYCTITNETADYFEVLVNDVGAGAVNDNFYFHATPLV